MILRCSPSSTADIIEATEWYSQQQAGLDVEFLEELDYQLHRIADAPLQLPRVRAGARKALMRRFPYSIYFRVVGDVAELIARMASSPRSARMAASNVTADSRELPAPTDPVPPYLNIPRYANARTTMPKITR